jgi:hypothetical protein
VTSHGGSGSPVHQDSGGPELLHRVRQICLALPETTEAGGVGNPSWRVRDKIFAMRHDSHAGRWGIWCKAQHDAQSSLVGADPVRFFVPPYVGVHGWVGISLEAEQDWDLVAELIQQAYRMTAPKRLLRLLDAREPEGVEPKSASRRGGLRR